MKTRIYFYLFKVKAYIEEAAILRNRPPCFDPLCDFLPFPSPRGEIFERLIWTSD